MFSFFENLNGTSVLFIVLGLIIFIGGPILILTIAYKQMMEKRKIEWFSQMRFVVLRIMVPRNNEKTPLAAEQMFASLHGIFRVGAPYQEYVSFEIAARDRYIQFYACIPAHLKDFIQNQIYAQYPVAEIAEVDDYTLDEENRIMSGEMKVCGTDLNLVNNDVFPIKTFLNFEVDPLSSITSVLSKINRDEQVWIQVLAKPISDDWQHKATSYVKAVKNGTNRNKGVMAIIFGGLGHLIGAVFATILGGATPASEKTVVPEIKLSGNEETGLKGVETKATKLGFEVKIRILALAPTEQVASDKISEIVGTFKQYNIINLNGFTTNKIYNSINFWSAFRSRYFFDDGYILNIEELASVFHLPSITVATPNIVWAGSKKGEPPANLPIVENVPDEELTVFAETNFRNTNHKFGIKLPDRRYHTYIIGKTGTGKSTLLQNMAIDDIREGRGVAIIDPHGDLVNHILEFIPEDRIKDVVWFSPADRLFPVAFNPLENVDPDLKSIVASGVVSIFKKLFAESWGPRLEYILRNTVLALLDYPNATMLGITRILVDRGFREKVVSHVKDPVIKDFFVNEFEQYEPKFRTEAIAPIQNKVGQFLSSSTIRNIVGQPKSTINIKEIMDTGKIFLVNLSVGEIGDDTAALLGSMMITKIQLAAMQRASMPEDERRDFYLYVDEFQNFATDSFAQILSEARKYHLNLIMTHQYIAQMPEAVRDAVIGNVGTILAFRVGTTDAEFLKREFEPIFESTDMVNLDNYHIYVKMSVDGVTCPAFSANTLAPISDSFDNRQAIVDFSRVTYSKNREFVEAQIEAVSELPKVDEILTKSEKKLIPKIPPKIGDTYYREIQNPGDVRWYLGGGTMDMPLDDTFVLEKIAKLEEKAKLAGEAKAEREAKLDDLTDWQKDRMKALEPESVEVKDDDSGISLEPEPEKAVEAPVIQPVINEEVPDMLDIPPAPAVVVVPTEPEKLLESPPVVIHEIQPQNKSQDHHEFWNKNQNSGSRWIDEHHEQRQSVFPAKPLEEGKTVKINVIKED